MNPTRKGVAAHASRPREGATLQLLLAAHRVVDTRRPFSAHDHDYFRDLLASFGQTLDQSAFDAGRVSFTELIAALVGDLGPYADRYDLALLASVTADAEPGWPMCYLSTAVPHPGLAFAVGEQGVLAPFTTLRLAADWARLDGIDRVLVFVLDQSTVLHTGPIPDRLRATEDAGVVLVLAAGCGGGVGMPETVLAEAGEIPGLWASYLAELAAADRPVTVVAGPELLTLLPAEPAGAVEVVAAPPGKPATGIWSVLAQWLPKWTIEGQLVVLADYDHDLRRLARCAIEILPRPEEVPAW